MYILLQRSNAGVLVQMQVAQVLLTLPYSFSQLGMLSGVLFQVFYGIMGSWTAYLISCLYIEYRLRKERENVSFKNHVIQVSHLTYCEAYVLNTPFFLTLIEVFFFGSYVI